MLDTDLQPCQSDTISEYDAVFAVTLEEAMLNTEIVINKETKKDPVLSKVYHNTLDGYPSKTDSVNEEVKQFQKRKEELAIEHSCVTWGNRVVIHTKLRSTVLEMSHLNHTGMSGMKMLARSYVWWPNLSTDIERIVKTCINCN